MRSFTSVDAVVVPIDRPNVDTDAIIPKQFMKSISRTGFGDNLFDEWRYLDLGEPGQDVSLRPRNPEFPLNMDCFSGGQVLLARENFGCGSSREHAPWALHDYGFRALIAPSFADIFYGNCFKNGMLPVVLPPHTVSELFSMVYDSPGMRVLVDLATQTVTPQGGEPIQFDVDEGRKHRLLNGLDDIALTLMRTTTIRQYEEARQRTEPWLFS